VAEEDLGESDGFRWIVLIIAWLSFTAVYMVRLAASPLSPFIVNDLKLSLTEVGFLTSASAMGYAVAQIPAGWLVDRIGVKKMIFIGTFSTGLFAMGMFLAQSLVFVGIILFLCGLGCGCFPTASMKAIVLWFQSRERGTAIGVNQTAMNVAGVVIAAVLPSLASSMGWRVGFLATGIVSISLAILTFLFYREPKRVQSQINLMRDDFPRWEKVKGVILNKNILMVALASLGLCIVEFSLLGYLVVFLNSSLSMSVAIAAGFLAIANGAGAIGKPFFGILSDRVFGGSRRKPLLIVAALVALTSLFMQFISKDSPNIALVGVIAVFGFGAIGWAGLNLLLVSEFASKDVTGFAVGFSVTIGLLGNIAGPPIFGFIADLTGSYSYAWLFLTGSSLASLLILLGVKEGTRSVKA
jgi:sugar phosphate permease